MHARSQFRPAQRGGPCFVPHGHVGVGDQLQSQAFQLCPLTCWSHCCCNKSHKPLGQAPQWIHFTVLLGRKACTGLAYLEWGCQQGWALSLPLPASRSHLRSLAHGPELRLQGQQQWMESFSSCVTLTISSASLFHFYFKSGYLGPPGYSKMLSLF